jgi:hypothetical protein
VRTYKISDVTGVFQKEGTTPVLKVEMIVTVSGKEPLLFSDKHFIAFVGADRTPADPPTTKRNPQPKRIGFPGKFRLARFEPIAPNQVVPVLIEPGRSAAFRITWEAPPTLEKWLKDHPGAPMCTVWDASDNPIGRKGFIEDYVNVESSIK